MFCCASFTHFDIHWCKTPISSCLLRFEANKYVANHKIGHFSAKVTWSCLLFTFGIREDEYHPWIKACRSLRSSISIITANSLRNIILTEVLIILTLLIVLLSHTRLNLSPPGQNGRYFADDILRCIFVNERFRILIKISLIFFPKSSIDNN